MDIVASSIHDDTIRWFENDGNVNPSFTAAIFTNAILQRNSYCRYGWRWRFGYICIEMMTQLPG